MSYILDALRKADAQRERGAVPGLHTQPVPVASHPAPRVRAKPLLWMGTGAAIVLAATLGWTLMRDDGPAAPGPADPPADAAPALAAPAGPAAPRSPVPLPVERLWPAPAVPAVAAPAPEPATRSRRPTPALGAARPVDRAAAPASDERVYSLRELPDAIRSGFPKLAIGGSIYSATPASRFLMINGQVFHEGDPVAPDLTLEQIKLKAAVLNYRGYRVGITY